MHLTFRALWMTLLCFVFPQFAQCGDIIVSEHSTGLGWGYSDEKYFTNSLSVHLNIEATSSLPYGRCNPDGLMHGRFLINHWGTNWISDTTVDYEAEITGTGEVYVDNTDCLSAGGFARVNDGSLLSVNVQTLSYYSLYARVSGDSAQLSSTSANLDINDERVINYTGGAPVSFYRNGSLQPGVTARYTFGMAALAGCNWQFPNGSGKISGYIHVRVTSTGGGAAPPPIESVARANGGFRLQWPNSVLNVVLTFSPTVDGTNWMTVTNAPLITNGTAIVVLDPTVGTRFFRLKSVE